MRQYGGAGRSAYYWETYHVFGDPSIQLRTTFTKQAAIEGPTEMPIGVSPISYTLTDGHGNALTGASAAFLNSEGEVLGTAIADAAGMVQFAPGADIAPGTKVRVVVNGANLRESALETTFISPNSPYLALKDFRLNGRVSMQVGAGEEVAIGLTVSNVGMVGTQGAMLGIESVQGPLSVVAG